MFSRVVNVLAAQGGDVAVATSRVATCPVLSADTAFSMGMTG